jgi:hypothetical protein
MIIKMVRQPDGFEEGIRLSRFKQGESYDVETALGEYLVMLGYAVVEKRMEQRSHRQRPERRNQRPIC